MPKIYRVMMEMDGLPAVGSERNMLGARYEDIQADANGDVHPRTGGLSVNICLCSVPPLILPRHLSLSGIVRGAKGADDGREGWRMGDGEFVPSRMAEGLELRPGSQHGFLEPDAIMPLAAYQGALAATQHLWNVVAEKNNDCPKCRKIAP